MNDVLAALADVGSSPNNDQTGDPPQRSRRARSDILRCKKSEHFHHKF